MKIGKCFVNHATGTNLINHDDINYFNGSCAKYRGFFYGYVENNSKDDKSSDSPIIAKKLLTEHEKRLFNQLIQLPNCHVFAQVSLAAFLHTQSWKTRNKFIRKIADFVITDPNLNILAVIELDDKSHDNKIDADKARDKMIQAAGYRTLRYRQMPTLEQLYNDIFIDRAGASNNAVI